MAELVGGTCQAAHDNIGYLHRRSLMGVLIDCDTCLVRGLACHECVVSVILGPPPELGFDDEETRALDVLADSGLVPKLRMVTPESGPDVASA
jgi:hypothetical protein